MRRIVILLAAVAMGVLLACGAAFAVTPRALWSMEDPTKLIDSSGNGNNGTTKNIIGVAGLTGDGYHFNGTSSMATVPSSASLNPGDANFRLTVPVKFTQVPSVAVGDYDLIRKGLAATPGGDYKVEILPNQSHTSTQAFCFFKDSSKRIGRIRKGPNLADGNWHTITCSKTATSVKLTVDGTTFTKTATVGKISNAASLTIGAKSGGGDWYSGDMDEVSIEVF